MTRSELQTELRERENSFMQCAVQNSMASSPAAPAAVGRAATVVLVAAILCSAAVCFAQQGKEKTFASPGDAVLALYNAAKANDTQAADAIFGSSAADILHTGDKVADENMRTDFVRRYDQMHRVLLEPDGMVTLYVGADNWPFPVSIAKSSGGSWYFDTEGGKKEILYRRIGRNENDAIDILHSLVDAQHDYMAETHDEDKTKHYAAKFISTEGKQDGLYWKTSDNDPPSPIGPLLVSAAGEGYNMQQGKAEPYHGYYYRILTKQGAAAKGGARDYMVNGLLTKGFAFVAYPAEYRNSGVVSFIVNQDGIVYEKDLGTDTAKIAGSMTEYNPDSSWSPAD
jgi:Protein of unknown function (DUF2950)